MAIGWTKTTFTFTFLPGYQNSAFANVFPIDVNGDGRPDLVFTPFLGYFVDKSERVEPIKILLNEGHGHFKDATSTFFPHGAPATLGGAVRSDCRLQWRWSAGSLPGSFWY